MRAFLILVSLFVYGCGPGKSVLSLTVDQNGGLGPIAALEITAENGGRVAQKSTWAPGGDITLPVTLDLVFEAGVSGATGVTVSARDQGAEVLATASTSVDVMPSTNVKATVLLRGVVVPDLLVADLAAPPDMTMTAPDRPCIPRGAEDCYNNIDDDCNGMTDCTDPRCTPETECVPQATAPFAFGAWVASGMQCPPRYAGGSLDIGSGLDGGPGCTGCKCNASITACSATVFKYASANACSGDVALNGGTNLGTVDMTNKRCITYPWNVGDTFRVGPYQTVNGPCMPSGAPARSAATWKESHRFCPLAAAGGGCGIGEICVPRLSRPAQCVLADGPQQSCPATYTKLTGPWYSGFTDTRSCGPCACGAQTPGDCSRFQNGSPVSLAIYFAGCGSGINNGATSNMKNCNAINNADGAFGFEAMASQVVQPSCPAVSALSGQLTPTGEKTICCQ